MSEVVKLARSPEHEAIIALCDEIAERARAGEFKTIMMIAVKNSGGWITRANGYSDGFQLTGMIATALQEQLQRMME